MKNLSIPKRIALLIAAFVCCMAMFGAWSYQAFERNRINGALYMEIDARQNLVAQVLPPPMFLMEAYQLAMEIRFARNRNQIDELASRAMDKKTEFQQAHLDWQKPSMDPELRRLLNASRSPGDALFEALFNQLIPAIRAGQKESTDYAQQAVVQAFEAHRLAVLEVVAQANKQVASAEASAEAEIARTERLLLLGMLLSIGFISWVTLHIVRGITVPLTATINSAHQIAAGQTDVSVGFTELPHELGNLARALVVLREEAAKVRTQSWVKQNVAEIASSLQQAASVEMLGDRFLAALAPLLRLGQGLLFTFEQDSETLQVKGRYAAPADTAAGRSFKLGEGLVGQCALERRTISLEDLPLGHPQIDVGLGQLTPKVLSLHPIVHNDQLLGVLELAMTDAFDPAEQELVDELLPVVAMSLQIIRRSLHTQQLLLDSRRQAEVLEKQAALMEEQTVELEAQQAEVLRVLDEQNTIFEQAPNGIAYVAEDVMIRINRRLAELLRSEAASLLNASVRVLFRDTEDFNAFKSQADAMIHEGGRVTLEWELKRNDGSTFLAEISSRRTDVQGHADSAIWSIDDITARKAAARELSENRALLAAVFDSIPDRIFYKNPQGVLIGANKAYLLSLGKPREAVVGKTDFELFTEEQARTFWEENQRVMHSRQPLRIERRQELANGSVRMFDTQLSPFLADDGLMLGILGISHDVTDRRDLEEQMRLAKELAEDATRTKSDFLANMSHEIRTPMNAIIGMSHLALQTGLDKKQRNYVEKVHRSAENLLGIINDILDFSKIEAGKMTLESVDFWLEDVLENLASLVGLKAEDKDLELLFDVAPDVPLALIGDPLRLGQVLINIGNNAIKFTERGEIVVRIERATVEGLADDQVQLHVSVRDSGIGMSEEQCARMFQSFSQADTSTTRKYGGTGLGLVISKNLVEQMHGRIWVESELGKGSTFHFHIRFGVQKQAVRRGSFRPEELAGLRALIADDNASAREILTSMTQQLGIRTDEARNGAEALSRIAGAGVMEQGYDLLLIDWQMPEMDGIDVARQLTLVAGAPSPAVVLVTGYGREDAVNAAQTRGVQLGAILTKPVTLKALTEALGGVLKGGVANIDDGHSVKNKPEHVMAGLAGLRLLLVEDNEMNQELALELLGQAGIEVVLAGNGQEALDQLAGEAEFDGVLMDCQMPVMDGYTATRKIRQNPRFNQLPILAMTANAMVGDREKVLEAGMWDHISKPLNVHAMFSTIRRWMVPGRSSATKLAPVARSSSELETTKASAVSQPLETDDFFALPGLNAKAGLATTMNNAALYRRMLGRFFEGQAAFAADFSRARQGGDPTAAARCAHTLKGTAGNIGASQVQSAAQTLEEACMNEAPAAEIDQKLEPVLEALTVVIDGLRGWQASALSLAQVAAPANKVGISLAELNIALKRLGLLLGDTDHEAVELVAELLERLAGAPPTPVLRRVARLLEGFDFDDALEALAPIVPA